VPPVIAPRVVGFPRLQPVSVPASKFIQVPPPPVAPPGSSPVISPIRGQWMGDARESRGEVRARFLPFPYFDQSLQPPKIRHTRVRAVSKMPLAGSMPQAPIAVGEAKAPKAGLTGQAPQAMGEGQAALAVTGSQGPGASASIQAPRAAAAPVIVRVRFASRSPRAGISGSSAHGTVGIKAPKGEGS
jgi:hypothetical protein